MSACLILEVTELQDWPERFKPFGRPLDDAPRGIPAERRPAVLQPDRETAEREAQRLAAAHPGKRFAIFECNALATTVQIPTHTTVGGQVFQHRQAAVLLAVTENDAVPF